MAEVARDSWSAWLALKEQGGIEPEGRDADFVRALKHELAPTTADLRSAVESVSIDTLVRGIFKQVMPFSRMFADVLAYFKAAGAKTGRDQWRVSLDEELPELKSFEEFLATWSSINGIVSVPALSSGAMWDLLGNAQRYPRGDPLGTKHSSNVDNWYRAYRDGRYAPIPTELDPARVATALKEPSTILAVVAQRILERASTHRDLMALYHSRSEDGPAGADFAPRGAYEFATILQNETDYWMGTMVLALDQWRDASNEDLTELGDRLSAFLAPWDRVDVPLQVSIADLERILSLPVWRKRHELYAVWVATQIVAALPDRTIELHHEDGAIVFAFKEAVVATIRTSIPQSGLSVSGAASWNIPRARVESAVCSRISGFGLTPLMARGACSSSK